MSGESRLDKDAHCFQPVYQPRGRYVNDHCLIVGDDGTWHLFHITGASGSSYRDAEAETTFGHATSSDLVSWDEQSDVLAIRRDSSHQPDHIFAPYVIRYRSLYYMLYSGINMTTRMQSMCLASSHDLLEWHEYENNPVFIPSRYWSESETWSDEWGGCRDPHVLFSGTHGLIMYYTAAAKGRDKSVIGCAVSDNPFAWQDGGPVLIRDRATNHYTHWTESACVIERDGLYYLFYTHGDGTRVVVSDDPLHFSDSADRRFSDAHASEVFELEHQWYITSCSRDPEDIEHQSSDRSRGLFLARLQWSGNEPHVTSLDDRQ